MMEIEIFVFKESGKYYTSEIALIEKDIPMYKEEFKQFIREHIPAKVEGGYIMVRDTNNVQSFHIALYKYSEIF